MAETYKPLFSEAMLEKADPETRARLKAMDAQNRARWQQRRVDGGPSDTPAPAKRGAGKMYRYRDAEGRVQFTDKPVPGSEPVTVDVSEPDATSRAQYEASLEDQSRMLEYFDAKNEEKAVAAAERREATRQNRQHKADCRERFLTLQDHRRGGAVYYDIGPDGDRVYLSEDELKIRIREAEREYLQFCGELPAYDLR